LLIVDRLRRQVGQVLDVRPRQDVDAVFAHTNPIQARIGTYSSESLIVKAYCPFEDFDSNTINQIAGMISINYDSAVGTTFNVNLVPNGVLTAINNMHIHQFGLHKSATTCDKAGGHYNPELNYGELTGLYGTISDTGMKTITAPMVKLDGPFNILGRSMVVHNSSGYRVGCCTITLAEIDGALSDNGYTDSKLECMEQFTYTFNSTTGTGSVANVNGGTNYTSHIHNFGNCSNYADIIYTFPTFTESMEWSLASTKIFQWAGRSVVRHTTEDLAVVDCCRVVHVSAQTNINPTFVSTGTTSATTSATTTTTTTTGSTTGSSVNFVVSLLILFFFVLL